MRATRAGVSKPTPSPSRETNLLYDTLDDIELVPTDNDLLALIQRTQGLELRLNPGPQPIPQSPNQYRTPTTQLDSTHVSFATRSASTPTGQYAIDATCPATSIPPVAVISYPHTRTHDDVKCLEYEYV